MSERLLKQVNKKPTSPLQLPDRLTKVGTAILNEALQLNREVTEAFPREDREGAQLGFPQFVIDQVATIGRRENGFLESISMEEDCGLDRRIMWKIPTDN